MLFYHILFLLGYKLKKLLDPKWKCDTMYLDILKIYIFILNKYLISIFLVFFYDFNTILLKKIF